MQTMYVHNLILSESSCATLFVLKKCKRDHMTPLFKELHYYIIIIYIYIYIYILSACEMMVRVQDGSFCVPSL